MFEEKKSIRVNTLWAERYRPKNLDTYIGNEHFKEKMASWIKENDVPHLFLYGGPGTGKTTAAKIIINNLDCDAMFINASDENNVDTIRTKVKNFASGIGFKPLKIVVLDECLDENTLVTVLRKGQEQNIPIKDLEDSTDLVKSWNVENDRVEWMPFNLLDKGIQDTLKIELENAEVINCTHDHKWYVESEGSPIVVTAKELHNYMYILSPIHQLQKIKIKSISEGIKRQVFDLTVQGNHNFFITKSSILTHNCDFITPSGQAALRNLMEVFSANTRFVLTANFKERVIDPIISRTQPFHLIPPSKKEVAEQVVKILKKEKIEFELSSVALIVNAFYPDIRHIINHAQLNTKNGKLTIQEKKIAESDYKTKIVSILSGNLSPKDKFKEIRQTIADARISDFADLYRILFDKVTDFAPNSVSAVILAISEGTFRDSLVIDKEINAVATIINILNTLK